MNKLQETLWQVAREYARQFGELLGVGPEFWVADQPWMCSFGDCYFFKKDYVSYWNVEVNAEYLFKVGDAFTIYPLAGIDLLGISVEGGGSDSKMGLNLGAGVEYQLSSNLALKAEYNYKTQYDGWSLLKFGVVIPF